MGTHVNVGSQIMEQHPASALGSPWSVAGDVIDDRIGLRIGNDHVLVGHALIIAHVACQCQVSAVG